MPSSVTANNILPFDRFAAELKAQLRLPLPGHDAQHRMSPSIRLHPSMDKPFLKQAKKGGVLVLIYPVEEVPYNVLMLRTDSNGVHSRQVSFPGGAVEPGDADVIATALREAEEETGINPDEVEIAGQLTHLYIPPSNFVIYPVVGIVNQKPDFIPDPVEVDRLIEYPVLSLLDEGIIKRKDIPVRGTIRLDAPYFDIQGYTVWGATAMVLSELREILLSVTNRKPTAESPEKP